MRRGVLGVALAVALTAGAALAAPAGARRDRHEPEPGEARRLLPLHSVNGARPAIVDRLDREVVLRGVNVNSLGDYFQANPALPTVVPVTGADWDRMAAHGFNVVRLLVSWSALEPTRGHIDRNYLAQVHRTVRAAARRGIYSLIDMHQDAWGKDIASPPGTTCPSGGEPAIGWDGAPAWATITDGADTCTHGDRESSEAVKTAWDSFYADRRGVQRHLVDVWRRVAREFAHEPAVAGFDLLNEPNHGHGADFAARLGAYYARAITAIRAGEADRHGLTHVVFFEPTIYGTPVPTGFSTDRDLVFAPHNYGDSIVGIPLEGLFDYFQTIARGYGTPMWIGEYGWFGDPAGSQPALARYAAKEDALRTAGDGWWQWRQACGDPHSVGRRGGTPDAVLVHFQRNGCPGDHNLGVVPEWACTWRPYPQATPGRVASRVAACGGPLDLTGTTTHPGVAEIWFPGPRPPTVTGYGFGRIRRTSVRGGWIVDVPVTGSYSLRVAA